MLFKILHPPQISYESLWSFQRANNLLAFAIRFGTWYQLAPIIQRKGLHSSPARKTLQASGTSLCQQHCLERVNYPSHFKEIAKLRETLLFKPIWQMATSTCAFIRHTPHTPHAWWERVFKMILVNHVLPGIHGKSHSPGTGFQFPRLPTLPFLAQKEAEKGKTTETRGLHGTFCSFCVVSSANKYSKP